MIVTSRYSESDDWMLDNYKGLWEIEETFQITKSDLEARPVHVSLEEHIKAHFLTCFVSLLIIRLIQSKLNRSYSPKVIQENLVRACCTHIERNWYIFDHCSDAMMDIGNAFNIDFSKKYMSLGDIRKAIGATKK